MHIERLPDLFEVTWRRRSIPEPTQERERAQHSHAEVRTWANIVIWVKFASSKIAIGSLSMIQVTASISQSLVNKINVMFEKRAVRIVFFPGR